MNIPVIAVRAAIFLAAVPLSHAYPGDPATWDTNGWELFSDTSIRPNQLASATEPDGRLRLVYVDAAMGQSNSGTTRYPVRSATFTGFATGSPAFRFTEGYVEGTPNGTRSNFREPDAALKAARTRLRIGLAETGEGYQVRYGWLGSLGGQVDSYFSDSPLIRFFPRNDGGTLARSGIGASGITCQAVAHQGSVGLGAASFFNNTDSLLYVRQEFENSKGMLDRFFNNPPGISDWGTNRRAVDLSSQLNAPAANGANQECDAYTLVSTWKITPSGLFDSYNFELRCLRTTYSYPTANPANATATVMESVVVDSFNTTNASFPVNTDTRGYLHPKILVGNNRSPSHLIYEQGQRIYVKVRGGFPQQVNELPDSFVTPSSLPLGYLADGIDPDAALDRLNRLHLVWRDADTPSFVHYARQNADGTFTQLVIGQANGAPTVTVGPGEYPYVAYPDSATGGLYIRYPQPLLAAYHGDFEDRDSDGRPGLMEFAFGQSDDSRATLPEIELTFENQHPEIAYFLNNTAVRDGTSLRFLIPDGNDTVEVAPAYSVNLLSWVTSGFSYQGLFTLAGNRRVVSYQDNGTIQDYPRQSYRVQVRRILGAP